MSEHLVSSSGSIPCAPSLEAPRCCPLPARASSISPPPGTGPGRSRGGEGSPGEAMKGRGTGPDADSFERTCPSLSHAAADPEARLAPPPGGLSYVQGNVTSQLLTKTVGQCLDDTAQRFPDREALVVMHEGIRKTFMQLKQEVDQAAAGLLELGLGKGDRLGVWGPNSYDWILMQLATAQAGIVLVSVNPGYQAEELEFVLKKVGCKALVFPSCFKTQRYFEILQQVCPELQGASPGALKSQRLPALTTVITLDSPQPGALQMHEVLQAGASSPLTRLREVQSSLSCQDPINIQFTSGTTGSPKGATLSHHNIVNNANNFGRRLKLHEGEPRIVLPSPLYHCLGSVGGTMVSIVLGTTLILASPSFQGKKTLEAITRERATYIYGTPTMYVDMLNQPDFSSFDLSTLRGGVIAGSPAPPELIKAIVGKMNVSEIVVGYGTTENSPVTFMGFPQDSLQQKTESVGRILPHTEARVVDSETDEVLPLGTPGELQTRGYCVMLGYWGDPQKTHEAISEDGWYRTGDMAILDEHGFCKIVGRYKDMIIRGGENIYPAELEDFLHRHPQVQEAQVVGVKDQRMGEEICACLRLKEGQRSTAEEIKAFCKGKIQKFKLREQMEQLLKL
ncbi:medium-chain acyl-CoA ligase ACSF2, mitochondrial isoform X3 [Ornithorhynchus anatinus]|uniref:medium-chain acyl-CoA ligase ACSF2, mitochondrial isoform X3 n=1 Tax=Ornithorhynchus anatinus TaxID=9258 RepID=UPI0010A8E954|nr:medium-chain acyl-CoA ligase ACSF2, mitochondrial isoform X3 [Ornithorhynchus anatinus]XP_028935793.1 medium-chain acyl-CoA ligase ACSF2, mitochondrial isoform X3 [Ornithorhynchus anatinus]XP_028935794.1 medium-chain acyl-CoA ligase ACSF2, mitochondrial isoform X3 [Ornithorhynchus anatinus]